MRKGVRLLWVADSGMHVIAAGEEELDEPWDNIHYLKFDFVQRGPFFLEAAQFTAASVVATKPSYLYKWIYRGNSCSQPSL